MAWVPTETKYQLKMGEISTQKINFHEIVRDVLFQVLNYVMVEER